MKYLIVFCFSYPSRYVNVGKCLTSDDTVS